MRARRWGTGGRTSLRASPPAFAGSALVGIMAEGIHRSLITRIDTSKRFSEVVIHGGSIVYLAGQVPEEASLAGDISDQVRSVFAQIEAHLASAGTSVDRILTMTIFLTDIRYISEMNGKLGARAHLPAPQHTHTQHALHLPPATALTNSGVRGVDAGRCRTCARHRIRDRARGPACVLLARSPLLPAAPRAPLPLLMHFPAHQTRARARLQGGLSRSSAKRRCKKRTS